MSFLIDLSEFKIFAVLFSFPRGVYGALVVSDFFEAEPSQGSGGGGGEKPDFLRSENVALCLFTSKAMAVLRWFLPRESSRTEILFA